MRPLRTVFLYTAHHLGSAVVFNAIAQCPHLEIAGIVRGPALPPTRDGRMRRPGLKQARRVGLRFALTLYGHHLVQRVALTLAGLINPLRGRGILPCRRLAGQHGWRFLDCPNVNSADGKAFIKDTAPDLVIAAYFSQIVDPDVIAIPRLGILNLHPGWLPAYRGAMSYAWALVKGEETGGATVHWMDPGIDTGPIVVRCRFPVASQETVSALMVETAWHGAELIERTSAALAGGGALDPVDVSGEPAAHYPMPKLDDVRPLLRQNRYFHIRDIAQTVWHGRDTRSMPEATEMSRSNL